MSFKTLPIGVTIGEFVGTRTWDRGVVLNFHTQQKKLRMGTEGIYVGIK